jgi:N-methylhydantoinase A/oxoprolinase/acetone carboxylase beta subunit
MKSPRGYRVGFDVGGTFTDVIVVGDHGKAVVEKVLTTPHDPSIAVKQGVEAALARTGATIRDVDLGIHATTLVTNAIIERRGATLGVVTTKGFRDILEIGGGTRYDVYDLFLPFPAPLADRRNRIEVTERINANGDVTAPLDRSALLDGVRMLVTQGVDALAICFLHSYSNDANEREARAAIAVAFPDLPISTSAELTSELGEVERFSTAAANAYVQPLMSHYLGELASWLGETHLLLMGSNGGTLPVETARRFPVLLIESGPAAGALAASEYSRRTDRPNVVSFDMGGTTAKICLIDDGVVSIATEFEAARAERFKPGSGLPLRLPVVNLIEIGAGGGSIARVDDLGLLKVGPSSAGAEPGPACYARGGDSPTVTDANLILGFLDEGSFLGGDMPLDRKQAERAVQTHIARPLGVNCLEAAWGIYDVVNETMAAALRMHVAERNRDPRKYALMAFGGAGPAHAVAVARKVGIPEVVVPLGAGATSALGLLIAPPTIDVSHTHVARVRDLDWSALEAVFTMLRDRALGLLADTRTNAETLIYQYSVDLRYAGQAHVISVGFEPSLATRHHSSELLEAFAQRYAELYSALGPGFEVEASIWRLRVTAPPIALQLGSGTRHVASQDTSMRPVYFGDTGPLNARVISHDALKPGDTVEGPAVIEQRESTVLIGPSDKAALDDHLNVLISVAQGGNGAR